MINFTNLIHGLNKGVTLAALHSVFLSPLNFASFTFYQYCADYMRNPLENWGEIYILITKGKKVGTVKFDYFHVFGV